MMPSKRDLGLDRFDIQPPMFAPDPHSESEIAQWGRFPSDLTVVEWDSSRRNRNAVERLAQYFRREFGYDFVQYSAVEGRGEDRYPPVAFLWQSRVDYIHIGIHDVAVGATCFRWREWADAPAGWAMQWIWFHPYVRRTGRLRTAWPAFQRAFGDFHAERPLSPAMKAFLKRVEAMDQAD